MIRDNVTWFNNILLQIFKYFLSKKNFNIYEVSKIGWNYKAYYFWYMVPEELNIFEKTLIVNNTDAVALFQISLDSNIILIT